MNELNISCSLVGGSCKSQNFVEALSLAAQIYEVMYQVLASAKPNLLDSTSSYAELGKELSEKVFNLTHPSLLGKMIYTSADF